MAIIHIEELTNGVSELVEFAQPIIKVGRVIGNDIVLPSHSVSKWHAEICFGDRSVAIYDRNSRNGVFVNGSRIKQSKPLSRNDNIRIGGYLLSLNGTQMSASSDDGIHIDAANHSIPTINGKFDNRDNRGLFGRFYRAFFERKKTGEFVSESNQTQRSSILAPTKISLRKFINASFPLESDFEALCLDLFPTVQVKFTSGMDRVTKMNLLLASIPVEVIFARINRHCNEHIAEHLGLIVYENEEE